MIFMTHQVTVLSIDCSSVCPKEARYKTNKIHWTCQERPSSIGNTAIPVRLLFILWSNANAHVPDPRWNRVAPHVRGILKSQSKLVSSPTRRMAFFNAAYSVVEIQKVQCNNNGNP